MGSPAPCGQEASAAMWEEGGKAQAPRPRRPVVTGKAASADPPPPGPSGHRCHYQVSPRHRLTTQPYCEVARPSSEL